MTQTGVMIAALGVAHDVNVPAQIALVEAGDLIARVERSALMVWPDRG